MRITIKMSKNSKGPIRAEGEYVRKDKLGRSGPSLPHWRRCGCIPLDVREVCYIAKNSKRVRVTLQAWGLRCMVSTSGGLQEIAFHGHLQGKAEGQAYRESWDATVFKVWSTVSHQEGVVTGSRPSLQNFQVTVCSGAQLCWVSLTVFIYTHPIDYEARAR